MSTTIKVFDPVLDHAKIQHQPQEVFRVRGWEGGLDFSPPQIGRITFGDLVGMSVFRILVGRREQVHLMLFAKGRPRPLDIDDPGKIQYEDFSFLSQDRLGMAKFRDLTLWIARSATQIVVDRGTAGFLKQGEISLLEREPQILATSFASVLKNFLAPPQAPVAPGETAPPAPVTTVPAIPPPSPAVSSTPPVTSRVDRRARVEIPMIRPYSQPADLPFMEALAYPFRGKGLIAWLCLTLTGLAIPHFYMRAQFGLTIALYVAYIWYAPSLMLAIIRHGAAGEGQLEFPKILDLGERISDILVLVSLSAYALLIVVLAAILGMWLALRGYPPLVATPLAFVATVYLGLVIAMAFGAVGAYGDRKMALRLKSHHQALQRCLGPLIQSILVSLVPVVAGLLVLYVTLGGSIFSTVQQDMAAVAGGWAISSGRDKLILYFLIMGSASAAATLTSSYLLGAMFRIRGDELSATYSVTSESQSQKTRTRGPG